VLLVIVDHAGFRTAAGGFIGVDVFFVISGFLITGLLVREMESERRLSIADFYARRARRILPAAILVLVVTSVASLVVLPLVRAVEVLKDAVWAAFFAANFRFASVGTDYFAHTEPASPLQHYWSLSVEEQYYLVWPLVLIALLAIWRRHGGVPSRRALSLVLTGAIAVSLAWSVHATWASPTAAYFSTATRTWELGIGSLTAVLIVGRHWRLPPLLAHLLAWGGIGTILWATLVFDAHTAVPGWIVAIPVIGTAVVLATGSTSAGRDTWVFKLLSIRPVRTIGDWSYSMYLWHFPVLRLAEEHFGERRLTHGQLLVTFVVILVLSALSYRFVEEPFRRGQGPLGNRWRAIAIYPAGLVIVLAVSAGGRVYVDHELGGGHHASITTAEFHSAKLSKDPHVALVEASVLAARQHRAIPSDLSPPLLGLRQDTASLGDCDYRTGTHQLCPNGDTTAHRSIVILGDSHARAWSPAIDAIGAKYGYATYSLVYSGCPANQAPQMSWDTRRPWQECLDFRQWALTAVQQLHPALVVIANSALAPIAGPGGTLLGYQSDRSQFISALTDGLGAEVSLLQADAGKVAVLGNTPQLPRETGVCLSSRNVNLGDCLFRPAKVKATIQKDFLARARSEGALVVDALPWFCAHGLCPSVIGNTIPMRDKEHVTPEYARELADPLARKLGLAG
jgi:peptidoglycan/LPS O-acetylase OafA/YrhL